MTKLQKSICGDREHCLFLIANYAFIYDKSKSEQVSELREKSEEQRTAEFFIIRSNTNMIL